jgi:hypothetical protein
MNQNKDLQWYQIRNCSKQDKNETLEKIQSKKVCSKEIARAQDKKTSLEKNKLEEKEMMVRQATKGEQEHSKFYDC